MQGHLKIAYEAPDQTMPIWIALNQVMWWHTKACITNSSLVHKRENRAWLKLTDIIFGTSCPPVNFLKNHILDWSFLFQFSGKHAPYLMDPLGLHSQSWCTTATVPLLGYASKNRSSWRVVTGKLLTEKLNTGLFVSPSGISELECATTKTDMAEWSISIGRESLQVFFCTRGLGVIPGSTARG